jgi:hypothetical protein
MAWRRRGYETDLGQMLCARAEDLDQDADLIFTSPPWVPTDLGWYAGMFELLAERLTASGSMVVVLGNEWRPPNQTGRTLDALRLIAKASRLQLAQTFVVVHDEPLMSPSVSDQMKVEIGVRRVHDHHTHAWWLTGPTPKVNVGPVSSSVIYAAETPPDWRYLEYCREHGVERHAAMMPLSLPSYFVKLLTDPGDLVVDPFAGSNATGAAAEKHGRRWLSVESDLGHVSSSRGRFTEVSERV